MTNQEAIAALIDLEKSIVQHWVYDPARKTYYGIAIDKAIATLGNMEPPKNIPELSDIQFMPVCTKCGSVLYEDIDCIVEDTIPHINPRVCPTCGCPFTSITMPTKLPYHYDKFKFSLSL